MTQQYRGELTALAWLTAMLTGCGGWVDLDSPEAGGGSASGSVGTAGQPAASGGAVGTAGTGSIGRGQSGAPTNQPVANGEGGDLLGSGGAETGPAPHGRFQLLQAPAFSGAAASDALGDVLIGSSGIQAGASEAVLWDGVGLVGIAAYLTTLGVNLNGAQLQSAERVATRDGTTIVQGLTDEQNRVGAWIAWLPQRY